MFNILFLGDVVGKAGRKIVQNELPSLKAKFNPEVVIANGENAAGGLGIDQRTAGELLSSGVDIITTGNHVWSNKDILPCLGMTDARVIRPANYPPAAPGKGSLIWKTPSGFTVAVINLMGRVFMGEILDCPFRTATQILEGEAGKADFVVVDIHAEATSEKIAMGYHLDGRAALVAGTHTHVQTADERLLPQGTAYISDAGMCGPYDSVLGVKPDIIVERFLSGMPLRFNLAKGPGCLNAVVVNCDETSKKAVSIERVNLVREL